MGIKERRRENHSSFPRFWVERELGIKRLRFILGLIQY